MRPVSSNYMRGDRTSSNNEDASFMDSFSKGRGSFLSTLSSLIINFSLIFLTVGIAAAQATKADTSARASASVGISVTVARDTTSGRIDSLMGNRDTAAAGRDTVAAKKDTLEILNSNANYDTVPGFRVQLLTTQNLSEAIGMKARADSLLSNFNIYIVYDSPYYKVRVGDFRARYEANQAITFITDHGFPNAWSVPDNVFRNPPRKGN
jgi:SPOR domain